ncbi:type II toxin-antitoxin system ParD family antitoxin [Caulobacter sp. BE254]|uniref:type II toxin-antitoxin system ParD family antitoxin n=1 Tax=Caulobacter sp. BE254 TaxID=2817720 RepID=UPI002866EED2|nr:type II toxin-antitoxin system ParD family antitoxin [Caulobacter sp. BE254]MDR7118362.1 putative addiction module CopG family antidote [Caulobacter sp. BE254]
MTTRSVILPEPLEAFVEAEVASGAYPNADAVLAAAVDLLQREQRREAAKVERFKALIQEGLDDLDAGRFEIVEDLGAWFDQIEAELDEASRAA